MQVPTPTSASPSSVGALKNLKNRTDMTSSGASALLTILQVTSMKSGCLYLRRNERRQRRTRSRNGRFLPSGHNAKDQDSAAPDVI